MKNFTLLHDDSGFHLSPAYDLLPDIAERREHVLHFASSFLYPGRQQLIGMGNREKISKAEQIFDEIKTDVLNWKSVFRQWKVPGKEINRLDRGIAKRLSAQ